MKISVITTSLNAAGTIRDCLESVRQQTYGDVEHIVVDAASTDGTPLILQEYGADLARVISEPDRGIYDGMNKGLRLATGEVVGILNADDLYSGSEVLARVARLFEEKGAQSCYGDLVYIAPDKQSPLPAVDLPKARGPWGRHCKVVRYWRSGGFDPLKFYWGWMVPHPTFFVRREVYERFGYFNPAMGTAADYELMLRFLLKHRIGSVYLPEILIAMRAGGASNATLKARLRANRMDRQAWAANGLRPYPWTLLLKPLRKLGQWGTKPPGLKQADGGYGVR